VRMSTSTATRRLAIPSSEKVTTLENIGRP